MIAGFRKNESTLFWLTAAAVLFVGWGLRDPWPADEPRFMLVAKQMVESGNWLFPMRGDELYPDKPPIFMWLQAILYSLTGSVRFSFLLPSLLSGLGVLWLVRDLGRRLWPSSENNAWHAGAIAAWMLMFALMFTYQFKRAQIDPLITLWITLGMYGFLRHYLERENRKLWLMGWFFSGLGIITKGVGFLPLLVLIPTAYASMRGWNFMSVRRASVGLRVAGPLMLLLPIVLWLIPMALVAYGGNDPMFRAYADNILFKQTAGRYSNPWLHQQPWYYFIEVIALQWLPVTLALPFVLKHWRSALQARDARILLPLAWIVLTVLFFSFSSGKREVYILPCLPMFCLIVAPYVREMLQGVWLPRLLAVFNVLLIALLIAGGAGLVFEWFKTPATIAGQGAAVGWMLMSIGLGALGASVFLSTVFKPAAIIGTLAALWIGLSLLAYPMLNDGSSAKGLMDDVAASMPADSQLALVQWKEQNLLMAHGKPKTFGFLRPPLAQWQDGAKWAMEQPSQRWVLVEKLALPHCMQSTSTTYYKGRYNRREWFLIPGSALCVASDQEMRDVERDPTKGFQDAFE